MFLLERANRLATPCRAGSRACYRLLPESLPRFQPIPFDSSTLLPCSGPRVTSIFYNDLHALFLLVAVPCHDSSAKERLDGISFKRICPHTLTKVQSLLLTTDGWRGAGRQRGGGTDRWHRGR